jgi:hypothetical protein
VFVVAVLAAAILAAVYLQSRRPGPDTDLGLGESLPELFRHPWFCIVTPNGWSLTCYEDGSGRMEYGASVADSVDFQAGTIDFPTAVQRLRQATGTDSALSAYVYAGPGSPRSRAKGVRWPAVTSVQQMGAERFPVRSSAVPFALSLFARVARRHAALPWGRYFEELWQKRPPAATVE